MQIVGIIALDLSVKPPLFNEIYSAPDLKR